MNCHDLRDRLTDLLDGALAPDEASQAAAHLEDCAGCAAVRERVERLIADLGTLAEEPAPDGLAERVLARVPRPAPRVGGGRLPGELRRVAGWGLVLLGLGWQLGGGALVARAMDQAAPVLAEARETVVRTRKEGSLDVVARELAPMTDGVSAVARGVRAAREILTTPPDDRPAR